MGQYFSSLLGIKNLSARSSGPPVLIVMTRHAARFSGEASADRRSAWVSWPEFARTVHGCPSGADVLRIAATLHTPSEPSPVDAPFASSATKTSYNFDGVEIEVVIRTD